MNSKPVYSEILFQFMWPLKDIGSVLRGELEHGISEVRVLQGGSLQGTDRDVSSLRLLLHSQALPRMAKRKRLSDH